MEFTYRIASAGDAGRINALYREMLASVLHGGDPEGYEPGYLDKFFAGNEDLIYVAEHEGAVAAFLSVEVYRAEDYIYLDDFSVTEKYRGRGVGTRLLKMAEDYARKIGVTRISLHVNKTNEKAHGLYKRLGYGLYAEETDRFLLVKTVGE